jgi:hypothetical protein
MNKIIALFTLFALMFVWQACPSSKKQRDTRNLSWYQIISDGKNKQVEIGVNENFPELIALIEEKSKNEILKKLSIEVKVSAYSSLTQIEQFDLLVDDIGNMNLLAKQNLLVNPVFSKIVTCDQKMKEDPNYKAWLDLTKNQFVPLVNYEPVFENGDADNPGKNRNSFLLIAYELPENPEYFRQSPEVDVQKANELVDAAKNKLEESPFPKVYHASQNGMNLNNPLFLGIPKSSSNIAAAMLVTDALINEIANDQQFISIILQPEIKPSFQKNWYELLFKDEAK